MKRGADSGAAAEAGSSDDVAYTLRRVVQREGNRVEFYKHRGGVRLAVVRAGRRLHIDLPPGFTDDHADMLMSTLSRRLISDASLWDEAAHE